MPPCAHLGPPAAGLCGKSTGNGRPLQRDFSMHCGVRQARDLKDACSANVLILTAVDKGRRSAVWAPCDERLVLVLLHQLRDLRFLGGCRLQAVPPVPP